MGARIRTLKPEVMTHRKVGRYSDRAFRLFVGMLTQADDEGRLVADTEQLRIHCFGYQKLKTDQVVVALQEIEASGTVQLYAVRGTLYAAFQSWKDHQRVQHPTPSTLPAPTDAEATPSGAFLRLHERSGEVLNTHETSGALMRPQASRARADRIGSDRIGSDRIGREGIGREGIGREGIGGEARGGDRRAPSRPRLRTGQARTDGRTRTATDPTPVAMTPDPTPPPPAPPADANGHTRLSPGDEGQVARRVIAAYCDGYAAKFGRPPLRPRGREAAVFVSLVREQPEAEILANLRALFEVGTAWTRKTGAYTPAAFRQAYSDLTVMRQRGEA
jgi:hypothetical protein